MKSTFGICIYLSGIFFFSQYTLAKKSVTDSLLLEGNKSIEYENYLLALDQLQKAVNLLETNKSEKSNLAEAYLKLAICYDYFDYFDYSKSFAEKALVLFKNLNDKDGIANCYLLLGDMLEDAGENKKALQYHQKALVYFNQVDNKKGIAAVYDNISSVYENYLKFDSSLFYLQKSLNIYSNLRDSLGMSVVLNNFGDIYIKLNKYKKALQYYRSSQNIAQRIANKEEVRGNLKDIAKAYASLNDYKNAYQNFVEFFEKHRTLKIEKKIEEIARLQVQYSHQKNQLELEAIQNERQIESLRYIVALTSLGMLFLIILFIYIAYRLQTYKDKQLEILRREKLEVELEMRKKKLLDYTHTLAERGEIIEDLKRKIDETLQKDKLGESQKHKSIQKLMNSIILTEDDWQKFKKEFESVYDGFFAKILEQHPDFSPGDLRLTALLKLKLSFTEIGNMMGISPDSVKKASKRLKKKISEEESFKLKDWIKSL